MPAKHSIVCYCRFVQLAAANVVNALWVLMEVGVEELRLLQTAILLITTSSVVQHEVLARVC